MTLYSEGTTIVLDPLRKTTQSLLLMGSFERLSISRFQYGSEGDVVQLIQKSFHK